MSWIKIIPNGVDCGWIGRNPYNPNDGNIGAWFRKVWIGGTSLETAKIIADANGNVTVDGSVLVGTVSPERLGPGTINVGFGYIVIQHASGHKMQLAPDGLNALTAGNTAATINLYQNVLGYARIRAVTGFGISGQGDGVSADVSYAKPGGGSGTITIRGGIITSVT